MKNDLTDKTARLATLKTGLLALTVTLAINARAQSEPPTNLLAQSVQAINRVEAAQQAQADTLQKLLERIDQLEKKDAEQKALAATLQQALDEQQKAHAERERKLLGKIGELEGKVGSLEAGRVLPEIALPSDDSPTTQELQQQIRILERKNELAAEAADAKAKVAPKITAGQNGFGFVSADTNFALRVKGLMQLDSRTFFNDNPYLEGNSSFILRRARPIIEGTVFRDFDFNLTPDFAGTAATIFDAWVNYRYRPELQLRAGKFKEPLGLENLQSDTVSPFNERGFPSSLVSTRNIGIQLWGDLGEGIASYAVGVFNGAGDGRNPANNDFNDNKEFAARLFFQPFIKSDLNALRGLGFGAAGTYTIINTSATGLPGTTGGTLPGYSSPGQQQFFAYNPVLGTVQADGVHWRIAPQAYYYYGALGLLAEYTISHQAVLNTGTGGRAELENTAWQVSAQWVLTGEPASFTGITPKRPFDPRIGQWGAWQLVARFGELNIDPNTFPVFADPNLSAKGAVSWGVGVNWWLNKNVRVLTSFSHTTFDGGGVINPAVPATTLPPATVAHQAEDALFTRIQLSF